MVLIIFTIYSKSIVKHILPYAVDFQLNAKIADLELGQSESVDVSDIDPSQLLLNWTAPEVLASSSTYLHLLQDSY